MTINWETVALAAIVFIGTWAIIRTGASIKFGKDGLTATKGNVKPASPHASCASRFSIIGDIRKIRGIDGMLSKSKSDMLVEQMAYYEEREQEILSQHRNIFKDLLIKAGVPEDECSTNKEYKMFKAVLSDIYSKQKDEVRKWFINNHYATQSADEQVAYIKRKKDLVLNNMTERFDESWFGHLVKMSDLHAAQDPFVEDWMESVEAVFNRAFSVAREYAERNREAVSIEDATIAEAFGPGVTLKDLGGEA